MEVKKSLDGTAVEVSLVGRLDTLTAPEVQVKLLALIRDIEKLILDFSQLEYLSSAGLRVLLLMQKRMSAQGKMRLINVNSSIMEVFEMTGFNNILCIENQESE